MMSSFVVNYFIPFYIGACAAFAVIAVMEWIRSW